MRSEIESYLEDLTEVLSHQLGSCLAGLYVAGSLALDEFSPDLSDIDIIAVTGTGLTKEAKRRLAASLRHEQLACPAEGLDFVLYARTSVNPAVRVPRFDFSIASGRHWADEIELGGPYAGGVVDLEYCRQHGRVLIGPAAREMIGPIDSRWVLTELLQTVRWHRERIHDSFHDPYGYNAVLNASRAWTYRETRQLVSKRQGGEWLLARRPELAIVADAVRARERGTKATLERGAVRALLDLVEQELGPAGAPSD